MQAEVASEEFERAVERAARQLGRNLRVPGFRKGKVPAPVVIRRLGRTTVLDRARRDSFSRWYAAALADADIVPVGQPELDLGELPADGEPLSFSLEIGVCPTARLGRYKGLEVGRREPEVDDETVKAELEALRERLARAELVERPARRGDLVLIDFDGLVGGEPFDGGRGRDQMVELGSGMLVSDFEHQLEGASAGDERVVEIDFPHVESPEDHRAEEVAGDHATFIVAIKEVRAKSLPALDDAMALEAAGVDTLVELREDVAVKLLAADEQRVAEEFRSTVLDAVVAEADIELPDGLVDARAREICQAKLRSLDHEGVSKEVYLQISGKSETELVADTRPQAAVQLRREAVIAAVIETEGIEVSEEDLREVAAPLSETRGAVRPLERSLGPVTPRAVVARRRALALLAQKAFPISVEQAKADGKPWTPDEAASETGVAELWTAPR